MSFTTFIIGPILGAVIGLITNYIAIVMLFRPYRPWRIFGLKVPFTPGVIPSRHKQLAQSIGNAVGEYLITETELRRTLLDPALADQVEDYVLDQFDHAKGQQKTLRQLGEQIGLPVEQLRGQAQVWLSSAIWDRLKQDEIRAQLIAMLEAEIARLMELHPDPDELGAMVEKGVQAVMDWIERLISIPDNEAWLTEQVDQRIAKLAESEKSLSSLIGEDTVKMIVEMIRSQGPTLAKWVGDAILDRAVRQKIMDSLMRFLSNQWLLRTLGSALSPERLDHMLQKVLTEAALYLERPDNQALLVAKAEASLTEFLDRPVGEMIRSVGEQRVQAVARALMVQGRELVRSSGMADKAGRLVREQLSALGQQSWAFLSARVGLDGLPTKLLQNLEQTYLELLDRPALAQGLQAVIGRELDRLLNVPLANWLTALDTTKSRGLVHRLTVGALEMVAREASSILSLLDIRQMVTRKVEEFPLPVAEKIILDIAGKELAYITYFGGLLGLIIGVVQPLITLLTSR